MDNEESPAFAPFRIPDEIRAIALPEGYAWGSSAKYFFGVLNKKENWWEWYWYTEKADFIKTGTLINQEVERDSKNYGIIDNPIEAAHIMAAHLFLNITAE